MMLFHHKPAGYAWDLFSRDRDSIVKTLKYETEMGHYVGDIPNAANIADLTFPKTIHLTVEYDTSEWINVPVDEHLTLAIAKDYVDTLGTFANNQLVWRQHMRPEGVLSSFIYGGPRTQKICYLPDDIWDKLRTEDWSAVKPVVISSGIFYTGSEHTKFDYRQPIAEIELERPVGYMASLDVVTKALGCDTTKTREELVKDKKRATGMILLMYGQETHEHLLTDPEVEAHKQQFGDVPLYVTHFQFDRMWSGVSLSEKNFKVLTIRDCWDTMHKTELEGLKEKLAAVPGADVEWDYANR